MLALTAKDLGTVSFAWARNNLNRWKESLERDWKLLAYRSGTLKLYNIPKDIGEKHDLAASHPQKVSELKAKLMDWEKEMGVEQYSGIQ